MQQSSKDVPNDSMAIDNGPESKENIAVHEESTQSLRDIDLNCNLNEDKDNTSIATQASLPENLLQQRYSMKKFQKKGAAGSTSGKTLDPIPKAPRRLAQNREAAKKRTRYYSGKF